MSEFENLDAACDELIDACSALQVIDVPALWNSTPAPTQFVIEKYLPRRVVTLLGGHGGTGKSSLALAMAAHVAAGSPFLEHAVEPDRVAIVSLEDPADLVRTRMERVIATYGLPESDVLHNITLIDGSHADPSLAVTDSSGLNRTRAFDYLERIVTGHGLIVLDNASDAFAGNENARNEVRLFMRWLAAVAKQNDAALLLLAHVDKNAAKFGPKGNSYSGSTAWHNSARSRLALEADGGLLTLRHEKSNLGPLGPEQRLTFGEGGVVVPFVELGPMKQDFTDLLPAFRAAHKAGQTVYNNLTPGSHSAMAVLANFDPPQRYTDRAGKKLMARGIARLIRDGQLVIDTYQKANRTTGERLVVAHELRLEAVK